MGSKEEEKLFTCKDCGAHALRVWFDYTVAKHYAKTLACTCGVADDGIAAVHRYHVTTPCRDWGWLGERHGVEWEVTGEAVKKEAKTEDDERAVFCQDCVAGAAGDAWQTGGDSDQSKVDEESKEWWVFCYRCTHEVEFGWSGPNRSGNIRPAECTDFNPLECWPEPRYVANWRKKGWLRVNLTAGRDHS